MKQSLKQVSLPKRISGPQEFPPNFPLPPYNQFFSKLSAYEKTLQNYRVITWEKNFQYSKIHTADLESIFVKDNPFFMEMVELIEGYNQEVEKFNSIGSPILNGPWRSHFFVKLHNVLLEIVFTKNRTLQNYFIETVHSWALDQLSRFNGQDASTSKPGTGSTQRPMTGSTTMTRPQSGFPPPQIDQQRVKDFVKRPGSAVIPQGVIRPISGLMQTTRPVSGTGMTQTDHANNQENDPNSGSYKYIRPLSGWNRPVSSITRPWSSKSGDVIENIQEIGEDSRLVGGEQEPEQEEIREVEEEAGDVDDDNDVSPFSGNQPLPSQYIKGIMKDYKIGARTKIDYVDAPYERLRFYRHKNLLEEAFQKEERGKIPEPIEKPEVILYEKPVLFLQQQQKYREQKEEERKQAEALKAAAEAEKKLKGETEEQEEVPKKPTFGAKPTTKRRPRKKKKEYPYKASLVPDHIPYKDDNLFKIPRVLSAQSHIRNKFETKSTFLNYQPSDDPRELNMELKWFYNRNKEVNDKRVDEEMITMIKEWSSNKERIEGEISRKIQSEYDASQFQKIEYKPNIEEAKKIVISLSEDEGEEDEEAEDSDDDRSDSKPPGMKKRPFSSVMPRSHNYANSESAKVQKEIVLHDITGLEQMKSKRKIDEVRKLLGPNINANTREDEDKGKLPKTLSIFSNNNFISEKKTKTRPFSAFIQGQKPSLIRNEQMFEINEIKEKMAKHKVSATTKALVNALMIPEGLNDPIKLFRLPMPGSDLIKNPFAEVKKGKRKKGKGKKKKKK